VQLKDTVTEIYIKMNHQGPANEESTIEWVERVVSSCPKNRTIIGVIHVFLNIAQNCGHPMLTKPARKKNCAIKTLNQAEEMMIQMVGATKMGVVKMVVMMTTTMMVKANQDRNLKRLTKKPRKIKPKLGLNIKK